MKFYTAPEDAILRANYEMGKDDVETVHALQTAGFARSVKSVKQRRGQLGLLRYRFSGKKRLDRLGFWESARAATDALGAALRKAGVPDGVHTEPQTCRPRVIGAEVEVRSRDGFV